MENQSDIERDIIEAATHCFSSFSIKKTAIEDICKEAGISRPTFYKFFKNKNALVMRMAGQETARLSSNVVKFIDKYDDIADTFTEAIWYVLKGSEKSDVVGFLLRPENLDFTFEVSLGQWKTLTGQHKHWQALYREAERQGRLREGLDDADITHWLSMVRVMLVISYRKMNFDTAKTKRFIRQFVVAAIIQP